MLRILSAIIFSAMLIFSAGVAAAPKEPKILADSAIVIEATTGRVIYEKNADVVRPPASMTKMMTCILGLENLAPNEEIRISRAAQDTDYPELDLMAGDVVSANELMMGMMLVSDNGAAVALAQSISGSVPDFARLMNDKAWEIGCTNTNFVNPNGLPATNHYSTARDMALIAAYCMSNWDFRDIVSTQRETIHWMTPADVTVKVENYNKLLGKYKGANGIKTGWTRAAGGCLAASAKRGEIELIAIIMHSKDVDTRFDDAKKLFDYGFSRVSQIYGINVDSASRNVFVKNGTQATIEVGPEGNLTFPLLDDEYAGKLSVDYEIPRVLEAGIKTGDAVGKAILKYDGREVASVPVVARESVDKGSSVVSKIVGWTEPLITVAQDFLTVWLA